MLSLTQKKGLLKPFRILNPVTELSETEHLAIKILFHLENRDSTLLHKNKLPFT